MPAIQSYNQYIYKDGEWLLVGVGGETSNTTYTLTKSGNAITLTGSDDTTATVTVNEISSEQSTKLAGIAEGAEVNVNADWNATSGDAKILNKPTIPTQTSQLTNNSGFITKSVNNLDNYTTTTNMNTALENKLNTSLKGAANGLAELDANGLVPSSQLPSYVDDVLEYANKSSFPATGESGKIYVSQNDNKTYRWSGTAYVEISSSLALGTTSSTAFRGDYGNAAYAHAVTNKGSAFTSGLYKITTNAEGHVTGAVAVEKADITALGIPSTNTTYESKTAVSGGTDVSLVTTGEKYTWNNKQNALATQTAYNAKGTATKVPQITTNTLGQVTKIEEVTITQPTINNGQLTIQKNGTDVQTFTANQSGNVTANITVPTKVSELTNDSGYTTNTGTVTKVTAGIGLNTTSNDTATDGGNITGIGTLYLTKTGVTAGTYQGITIDKYGRVTAASNQGYTTNTGTITKVQANGTDVASSGTANIPAASTSAYGVTKLSDATNSTSTALAATANAVKKAYDLAASKTSNTGTVTSVGLTAGSGISISGSPVTTSGSITVGHSNSITAQTTSGLYPIKIDAQGHITQYGEAYEVATEEEIITMLNEMGIDVYGGTTNNPIDYTYYDQTEPFE